MIEGKNIFCFSNYWENDAAICPFRVNELTAAANPLKHMNSKSWDEKVEELILIIAPISRATTGGRVRSMRLQHRACGLDMRV